MQPPCKRGLSRSGSSGEVHFIFTLGSHTHTPPSASTTPAAAATHVGDFGVGALHVVGVLGARLAGRAQLLVHAGLVLGTPDAAVLLAGVLAEAAVLPAHRAVVQRDCGDNQSVSSSAFCPLQSIDRSIDRSQLDEHVAQQLSHSRPTGGSAQINCCSVVFSLTLAVGAVTLDSWVKSSPHRHVHFHKPEPKWLPLLFYSMLGQMCLQPVSELPRNENDAMFTLCTFSHFCKIKSKTKQFWKKSLCDVTEGTWYLSNTTPSVNFHLMLFCLLTGPFLWNVFFKNTSISGGC